MKWPTFILFVCFLSMTNTGFADDAPPPSLDMGDADAPTLEIDTDPPIPYYSSGISFDGVAAGRDKAYGVEFAFAPHRWHSIGLTPAYLRQSSRNGFGLDIDYMLRPMLRGLTGIMIGPSAGASLVRTAPKTRRFRIGMGAGYSHVFGGLFFGAVVGGDLRWTLIGSSRKRDFCVRVRGQIGFAWN